MKMLLIDGNSMLFRGFYATYYTNLMKTSNGIYTNAVFAFANMLNKAIDMIHPEYLVVAFDKGKHNFRHDLSEDYKGTRKSAPEELVPQFALVREYLEAYNITFLEYDNFEADDIIGSIAKKYKDVEIDILTSDRDMLQLIDDTTSVYLMKKGMSDLACYDEDALLRDFGVKPLQIIDLKGLMGDASDNIKGVAGIGPKTATKLINDYESVEGVYEHIEEIKGKLKEKLINDKESAFLSKTLATIKTDVEIDKDLEDFKNKLDYENVNKFYGKYEMHSLVKEVKTTIKKFNIKRVSRLSEDVLKDGSFFYIDTDGFKYYHSKIYGIAITNNDLSEYIPFEDLLSDKDALAYLSSDKHKYTYDLKYVLHAFKEHDLVLNNTDDLMLMAFLKDNYLDSIEAIFERYNLGVLDKLSDIYGTIKKPLLIDTIKQATRASRISSSLLSVTKDIEDALRQEEVYNLYKDIELPLSYVLCDMENEGIRCDKNVLDEIGKETLAKLNELEKAIYDLADETFNINSPKQLAEILFDKLGLPANKKRSTNVEQLQKIEDYHPIIKEIMKYRKYTKLYSSYVEGLSKYITDDEKIHTIYSQTITQTGRLSSYDPNLQNISVRDEDGRNIRKAFTASNKDNVLISSDYSQIELRVLASLANEEKMIEAFNKHTDIHTSTAMAVFGLNADEVTDNVRRQAKAVNFGVVYGISEFGLAKQTGISNIEARKFISNYFETYPKIKAFLDDSIRFCEENGYVTTMMNRRRYINEINSSNYMLKEFGKRAAMNSRVQGSAADLIKCAMIKIHKEMNRRNLKSKMILQIHDELIFDVCQDELDEMIDLIKEGMKNAYELNVTLDSSLSYAYSWYDAK